MAAPIDIETIYTLSVTLRGTSPPVWRRIELSSRTKLPQLHLILQIVMGWDNSHLHEFRSGGQAYAEPDPDDPRPGGDVADEWRVQISKLLPHVGSSCEYVYDFGDDWRHDVTVESINPVKPRKRYPVCIDGARSAPPEDIGGPPGYEHYLKILADWKHEDHKAMLAWHGRFDPDYFAITRVNQDLREAFPVHSLAAKKVGTNERGRA